MTAYRPLRERTKQARNRRGRQNRDDGIEFQSAFVCLGEPARVLFCPNSLKCLSASQPPCGWGWSASFGKGRIMSRWTVLAVVLVVSLLGAGMYGWSRMHAA